MATRRQRAKILHDNKNFFDAAADFNAAQKEYSMEMSRLQRVRGLTKHSTGTVDELNEEETEDIMTR